MSSDPAVVYIRDVCPRDGLQSEQPVPPQARAALVADLAAAGLRDVEAVSFVSPKAVPSMAEPDQVLAVVGPATTARWWALVPNRRGMELARASGVDAVTVTVSASDGYSNKNVGRSTAEAVGALPDLLAAADGAICDVVISCAFGSPFDDVSVSSVAAVVDAVRTAGPARVTLADTTGTATPRRIGDVLAAVGTEVGMHLHDSRGTALANALAALDRGVTRFDTAVGGLGGSPFAPGAGGNLATEDLVLVLEDQGVGTGIDLDALIAIARRLPALVGHDVPSRTSAAGGLAPFS